jgi:hypothetical protein
MMSGQLSIQLVFKPLAGFMALADITVPIAAGAKVHMDLSAIRTVIYHNPTGRGSTVNNGINGFDMVFRHPVLV